jgi:peptidoglycan hydrolase CwlO-like protein
MTKSKCQRIDSNYAFKLLSPDSKNARYSNLRQEKERIRKRMERLDDKVKQLNSSCAFNEHDKTGTDFFWGGGGDVTMSPKMLTHSYQ